MGFAHFRASAHFSSSYTGASLRGTRRSTLEDMFLASLVNIFLGLGIASKLALRSACVDVLRRNSLSPDLLAGCGADNE